MLRGSSYNSVDDRAQISEFLKSGVDGLIVAPTISDATGHALVRWLDTLSTPVVLVERTIPDDLLTQRLESVSTDHAYGAGLAIRHLHAEGHQRIGILLPPGSPTSKHIGRGWYQACTQLGLSTDESLKGDSVGFNSPDRETVMAETLERIRAPEPPRCSCTPTPRPSHCCSTALIKGFPCPMTWRSWRTTTRSRPWGTHRSPLSDHQSSTSVGSPLNRWLPDSTKETNVRFIECS